MRDQAHPFSSHRLLLVAFLLLPNTGVLAQPSTSPAETQRAGPAARHELEAFVDGMMAVHLRDKGIAGATVSVVRDGEILLAKGYGFADVHARTPVDPARTLFRIGSVTKLFTATAVMQLVQDGRLDLHTDVNRYLDFEIPTTGREPITLTHLLTHTPGFEDEIRLLFTYEPEDILPLREWLIRTMPERVRAPGTFAAYSNYGVALAGYIVERISGLSWDEYIERNILVPLRMTQTTGRQPLPEAMVPDMSRGYVRDRGGWDPKRWEIVTGAAPAGSISSTATDMTRFMLAHLGGGVVDGVRILDDRTVHRMHARHFGHDARLPGFGLGFYEQFSHGVRVIGHAGSTAWFHSLMALVPAHGLGVFVSFNTDTAAQLPMGPFLADWLNHFFPPVPAAVTPVTTREDFADRVRGLTGTYRVNRISYSTFQKVLGLVATMSVEQGEDALVARSMFGELRLVEEEPLLFRDEVGHTRLAFRTDETGRATHAFLSVIPMMALERLPWYGLPMLHAAVLGGGMIVFAGIVLTAVIRAFRRALGQGGPRPARYLALGRTAITVAAAAQLAFLVSVAILAMDFDPWVFFAGPMRGLWIALTFPVLGTLATVGALVALLKSWSRRQATRWAYARLGAAVTVALLFAWSLNYWNLLGWRM